MMFEKIEAKDIPFAPFELKKKWMLVTAQKEGVTNTMTASWGGMGVMWNKEVVFVVIRPQRYTKEFVDNADCFSLSFFDEKYLTDLSYLGKTSGRDEDKIAKVGFTIEQSKDNVPYFSEAETVMVVKKLYKQPMEGDFLLETNIDAHWYPEKDYHELYIAEVVEVLNKKK